MIQSPPEETAICSSRHILFFRLDFLFSFLFKCGCPAQLYPLTNLAGMAAHPRQTFLHFISGDESRTSWISWKNVAPVHVSWLLFYV